MAEIIKIYDQKFLHERLATLWTWTVPLDTKRDLVRFFEELALGKVNRGTRLSAGAQLKYLNTLRLPLEYFNKTVEQLSQADIERFEQALYTDQIKSRFKGGIFSHATKVAFRKSLKVFLRWKLGKAKAEELVGWLDTRYRAKTPDYLKEQDVQRLYDACSSAEQRFLIAVLFDSGARAEELINIRLEDVHLPEAGENFVKLALKEEYSKTKGRTISLFWQPSLAALKDYVDLRISEGVKPTEPIYNNTYSAMRMFLHRLGKTILKRRVHPHLFRHSSATYYATKLNRQELCYRYAWAFSSNMPDVYISRAGMEHKELDQRLAQSHIGELNQKLTKVELDAKMKDERLRQLERQMAIIAENFPLLADAWTKNPTIALVESALQKKRSTNSKHLRTN